MEIGHPGQLELPKGVDWFGWGQNDATLLGLRKMDNSIVQVSSSGSGDVSKIEEMPSSMVGAPGISPDGQSMVVTSSEKLTRVSLRGGAVADPPKVLAEDSQGVFEPSISPDGHWLAYADFGAGGGIFVQPFPLPGLRRQIASDGSCPVWTMDGKEILYVKSGQLTSASFDANGRSHQSEPRMLFSGLRFPSDGVLSATPLAVSHDGQRIFSIQEPKQSGINIVNVIIGQ
jgi:Tol biopolymer transport system component